MKFSDLIIDPATGGLSHTKLWSNIAYLSATIAFAYEVHQHTDSEWLWLIYLGVVGASQSVSKLLSLKYGGASTKDN